MSCHVIWYNDQKVQGENETTRRQVLFNRMAKTNRNRDTAIHRQEEPEQPSTI